MKIHDIFKMLDVWSTAAAKDHRRCCGEKEDNDTPELGEAQSGNESNSVKEVVHTEDKAQGGQV